MKVYVTYQGDLGRGNTEVAVNDYTTVQEFISLFHAQTGIPETYSIGAGVPPFRRKIAVNYDYQINGSFIRDTSIKLSHLGIADKNEVEIIIGGGGKVD